MDPASWYSMANQGALAAFAVAVMYGLWRIVSYGGSRALQLGERYVSSTEVLHEALKESDLKQKELCEGHREALTMMTESIDENIVIQRQQCEHLRTLVDLHQSPSGPVTGSIAATHSIHGDMKRMKRAAVRACEMCRAIAHTEFPNSAQQIDRHCVEIERLIQDSGEISLGPSK
jgi:hypothetical protein